MFCKAKHMGRIPIWLCQRRRLAAEVFCFIRRRRITRAPFDILSERVPIRVPFLIWHDSGDEKPHVLQSKTCGKNTVRLTTASFPIYPSTITAFNTAHQQNC